MKFFWCTSLVLLFVLSTCTTKDGNIVSSQSGTGSLEVSSTVPDARVFVDHKDTGQRTPALIENLSEGKHVVHIFLSKHEALPESALVDISAGGVTAIDFELNKSPQVGNLGVSSEPPGALVFIDNLPFGRTPLEVEGLLNGIHRLKIVKGGYALEVREVEIQADHRVVIGIPLSLKRFVLVEHFSNTDCPPCPVADATVEAVLHDVGVDSVAGLTYHPNFPGSEDPMFLAAEAHNLARMAYYQLLAVPTVVVDGVFTILSPNNLEAQLRDALQARFQLSPLATLDFYDFWETLSQPGEISGTVVVRALEDLPADVSLRIALIEREVEFPVPPGTNGQKRFTDVLRSFYPDAQGIAIALGKDETAAHDFRFHRDPEWIGELHVIAFLQNDATREILQAVWTVLP